MPTSKSEAVFKAMQPKLQCGRCRSQDSSVKRRQMELFDRQHLTGGMYCDDCSNEDGTYCASFTQPRGKV